MELLRSLAMTFSMFSRVPVPQVAWKQENMRYMLSLLPLVGLVIGIGELGWIYLCRVLNLGQTLYAAGLTLLPVLISGGVHLDGFCDTVDALSSHAAPEKKREILKDPHAGAFAIIFGCVCLLGYFGFASELSRSFKTGAALGLLHGLARAMGAFAGKVFPGSKATGLLAGFREAADRRALAALIALGAVLALGLVALAPIPGMVMVLTGLMLLLWLGRMARREFGGMSGDLAGYYITLAELAMLAAMVLTGKAVTL